jgi:hypothetical protein
LAETKVTFIQNSLKIRLSKLEHRHEPLNHQTPRSYTPQQNLCQKFISTIYTGHSHPYEHCFVDLDATRLYSNETYRAGVSYAVAYQVYNIIDQVLTPFPHSFHSIPFFEPGYDPGINTPPSPHHYHPSLSRQANSLSALSQGP